MAKGKMRSKMRSKVQQPAKLRRGNSAQRGKARKVAKSAKATKRTAKPKPAPVRKAARPTKQLLAPAAEIVAVEVIEQPEALTEVEETAKRAKRAEMSYDEIQRVTEIERVANGKPSHFDMDEAFCARMRAPRAAGLETLPLPSSPRLELKTPYTSRT